MKPSILAAAAAGLLCMPSTWGADAVSGLDLRTAIDRAIDANPDLAHFGFELRAQEARVEQAGLKPPLALGAGLENFAGSGDYSGVSAAELTLTLSGVIEFGDQRARRVDAARGARDRLQVAQQSAQLDTLAEVARRFIHVASDQEQLELTRLATQLAQDTVAEVERRVQAARSPTVELARARITLARARVEQEHAEHELLTSRRRLAAMWGARDTDFDAVTADLYRLPQILDFEVLAQSLAGSPDFLAFATESRQREAELQLAMARSRAAVSWNVGVRRLQREHDVALVAGFSMPLFNRARAGPAEAEARALREGVAARATAERVRAEATLYELVQELRHAITETELLRDEVLPEMQSALQDTEYAWRRGRYSFLEWTEAQRERIAVQRALIESAANVQIYQIEIERLTRSAIPGESP